MIVGGAFGMVTSISAVSAAEADSKRRPGRPPACRNGRKACGRRCADLQTNPSHCGKCGNRCAPGQTCASGQCTGGGGKTCPGTQVRCGAACVDTGSDRAHCGGCGITCGAGQTCSGGTCHAETCPGTRTNCSGLCVDTTADAAHCGVCGRVCGAGEFCRNSNCRPEGDCPVVETKTDSTGFTSGYTIATNATLRCDGQLLVELTTSNRQPFAALRGRVRIQAVDAAGNTWRSGLFEATTRCSTTDPICFGQPRSGTDRMTEQAPLEVARRAVRLEIYQSNGGDPLP